MSLYLTPNLGRGTALKWLPAFTQLMLLLLWQSDRVSDDTTVCSVRGHVIRMIQHPGAFPFVKHKP